MREATMELELGRVTVGYVELHAGVMVAIERTALDSETPLNDLDLDVIAENLDRGHILKELRDEIVASGYDNLEYAWELSTIDGDTLRGLATSVMDRVFPDVIKPDWYLSNNE